MKRVLCCYLSAMVEMFFGLLFGIGFVNAAYRAVGGAAALVIYRTGHALAITLGDIIGGLICFVISRWLFREGFRMWQLASAASQVEVENA